jgi:GntR family transcriptional regulator of vanillate catabolism
MPITPIRTQEAKSPDSADAALEGSSQAVKAQQRLRELILAGQLPAGTRIAE